VAYQFKLTLVGQEEQAAFRVLHLKMALRLIDKKHASYPEQRKYSDIVFRQSVFQGSAPAFGVKALP
jgi:hypothetical protein